MIDLPEPLFPKPNRMGKDDKINLKKQKDKLIAECDRLANLIVKTRDKWICQRCGKSRGSLDWCHYIGRTKWAIRWVPENALTLCRECHTYLDNYDKNQFDDLIDEKFGSSVRNVLNQAKYNYIKLDAQNLTLIREDLWAKLKVLQKQHG